MAIGYFGVKLSGNVIETPEGYIVFKNAVIARTGFYTYKGIELLNDEVTASELEEQGVVVNPEDEIKVYRSPEEVFSKRSIDSFQMKSVTDGHPPKMLDLDSVAEHECGQVYNVREGKEPLEDGNFPLLGDIVVKDAGLIQKWKAGLRELSNGYNYHIVKVGETLCQVDIIGNHVAFVENGRAGIYAKVNDSKLITEEMTMEQQLETALGDGLKLVAEKSTGSQFGAFLRGLSFFGGRKMAGAMDEDKPKAVDADTHPEGCRCADCKPVAKDSAMDAKAKDRDRFHKALDRKLDAKDAMAEEQAAMEDADMSELEKMFGKADGKDEDMPGEAPEDTEAEAEEESAATDEDAEAEAEDSLEDIASTPIAPADRQQRDTPSATDAAYRAGAEAVLKALKPHVARVRNKSLTGAFDTASKVVKGAGTGKSGGYGAVARAAGKANDAAIESAKSEVDKQIEAAEAAYAKSRAAKLNRK